ncbi:MAG: hypothetical protein N7Q72_02630, partial [Spiroplasma sp. Tabriz.8]|nr:hypothetical protein [Spiroplasma sp. Tabriz.8]
CHAYIYIYTKVEFLFIFFIPKIKYQLFYSKFEWCHAYIYIYIYIMVSNKDVIVKLVQLKLSNELKISSLIKANSH